MIKEYAALDYLTMTSFLTNHYEHWNEMSLLYHDEMKPDESRRMQYEGLLWRSDAGTIFLGDGMQDGRSHFMMTSSGEMSEVALKWYQAGMRPSRIDIQITLKKPILWRARLFADALAGIPDEDWPNYRQPKIELYESGGKDTVYVGSRKSDRFQRWYIKEDDSKVQWLRFETQFRQKRAQQIWNVIPHSAESLGTILNAEYIRLPFKIRETDEMKPFTEYFEGKGAYPTSGGETIGDTLKWFRLQVTPAMKRLLNDPLRGGEFRQYVNLILKGMV